MAVTLGVTAALFGLGHLHGYPPGPLGAVLAGLYGVALGLLRWWAGGLGLAVACHVSADATIFIPPASVSAMDRIENTAAASDAVNTMKNFPSTKCSRDTGLHRIVSIVPRSFSPAVKSMAGYIAPP